jgi:hypothetical protein
MKDSLQVHIPRGSLLHVVETPGFWHGNCQIFCILPHLPHSLLLTMVSPVFSSLSALLVFSSSQLVPIDAFVVTPSHSKLSIVYQASENNEDEPDLFEYFDPLLSPHAYPKGIQPRAEGQVPDGEFRDPLRLTLIPRDDVDPLQQKEHLLIQITSIQPFRHTRIAMELPTLWAVTSEQSKLYRSKM